MKLFYHNSGSNPCGKPAFYAKATGAYNTFPSTKIEEVKLLDGTTPKKGDVLVCGSCGKDFSTYEETIFIVDRGAKKKTAQSLGVTSMR